MIKNPVPSGSCFIGGKERRILEAYLGTCVGVCIYSRQANLGGLIHLLLPEPCGEHPFGNPENYASIGMPVFLGDFLKQSGNCDDISATVAGGALVGPVTDMDLNLDIGGRTVEIVEDVLKKAGIPVIKSETGGYFSCRLSLDLYTGESLIKPVSSSLKPFEGSFKRVSEKEVEKSIATVRPIPQIALKVMRMLQLGEFNMDQVANEIKRDQIISARILKICNSAYFGRDMKLDSIDRALILLGERHLLETVVSASMSPCFTSDEGGYSLCKGGLFKHATGTALLCERMAEMGRIRSRDLAYTAGLLHDIGKVALDQHMNKAYPMFYRRTLENGENLIEVESEIFGIEHTEAGARLAKAWALPERLADVILHHHSPENSTVDSELTHLVYMADLIMSRFVVGQELDRINTHSLGARLEKIGVKPDQFQNLVENAAGLIHNLSA